MAFVVITDASSPVDCSTIQSATPGAPFALPDPSYRALASACPRADCCGAFLRPESVPVAGAAAWLRAKHGGEIPRGRRAGHVDFNMPTIRDKPVHVLFIGAGAVGCFYASRLHHVTKTRSPLLSSPPKRTHPSHIFQPLLYRAFPCCHCDRPADHKLSSPSMGSVHLSWRGQTTLLSRKMA